MSDPTISPSCVCVWMDGLRHNSPLCWEHGDNPELDAPCAECGGSGMLLTKHFDEYPSEVHVCDYCGGAGSYPRPAPVVAPSAEEPAEDVP